jgi:hypothetical protein
MYIKLREHAIADLVCTPLRGSCEESRGGILPESAREKKAAPRIKTAQKRASRRGALSAGRWTKSDPGDSGTGERKPVPEKQPRLGGRIPKKI